MAIQEQISKLEVGSASYAEKTTVVGQPDVPGLSTQEMQESVEYMPRNLLLPKLNEVVGAVNQCYTKAEADKAIAGKVTEIGAGDMAQAGYDPNGDVLTAGGITAYVNQKVTPAVEGIERAKGVSVALNPESWSGGAPYTQTIHVEWMTADWVAGCPTLNVDACHGDVGIIKQRKEEFAKLGMITSSNGALTFTAFEEKPGTWLDLDIPSFVKRGGRLDG